MRNTYQKSARVLAAGVTATLVLALAPGCQSNPGRRVARAEPGLSEVVEPGATVVQASPAPESAPATTVSFVDRHPLFSKPRQYYDKSTSNNKVLKTASATFLGVPAGFIGEIRQIVVGTPAQPTP